MSSSDNKPILVVGGGIGGLATAYGLGLQGHSVQLLEQSEEIAPIGYGVQIGPNVLPMLAKLGLERQVREAAYYPDNLTLYHALSGDLLAQVPLKGPAFEERYPAPYIAIHRVDLHEILLAACRKLSNVDLNQSSRILGFSQTNEGVAARTATGRMVEGAALIAADGLRSHIRAQMFPDDEAFSIGYVAHRTILPMNEAPASMRAQRGVAMWTGPNFHVIYYPLRDATEVNIVAVIKTPESEQIATDDKLYGAYIADLCKDARPEVHDILSIVSTERRWPISDRNPIRRWSDGRVTLLGDSAHATLQSLAQGAGMAIEDAVILVNLIKENGSNYEQAFKQFTQVRFLRTTRVQLESRALWPTYHCEGVDAEVRDQQMQERGADDFYRCLDWLWKPNLTNVALEF